MLVPVQAFVGPIGQHQHRLEPMLVPELMPQPGLEPQLELELLPMPELEPELMPQLAPMPQLELTPGPEQLLELELIHQLEPKLGLIIQPMVPQLEPMPEQRQQLVDQQPGQLQQEFLIIEPEQQLSHQELQQLIMSLHHLKAIDWSKQVILGSNPECMPRHRDTRFH